MPAQVLISEPSSVVLVNGWAVASSWFCAYFLYVRIGPFAGLGLSVQDQSSRASYTRYFLERILPRVYGETYTKMSIRDQKSFTVHHHWLTVKFLAVSGIYPYINIMFRKQELSAPVGPGASVSNADFLSVLYLAIIASFLWEISSRLAISPVSLIHHVAAVALSAWQLAGDVRGIPFTTEPITEWQKQAIQENDQQFKIIMTYGVFEVVFESWMHICCILHRVWEGDNRKRSKLWGAGGVWVLIGTLTELAIMSVLWHAYWPTWSIGMKCAMVILHFAFMAAQVHGARIGIQLSFKYRNKHREAERAKSDLAIEQGDRDPASASPIESPGLEKEGAEPVSATTAQSDYTLATRGSLAKSA